VLCKQSLCSCVQTERLSFWFNVKKVLVKAAEDSLCKVETKEGCAYLLVDLLLIEVVSRPRLSMVWDQVIQPIMGIDFLDGKVVCRRENGSTQKGHCQEDEKLFDNKRKTHVHC